MRCCREGLAKLLTEHDFEVVGTVADGDQLLEAAKRLRPDVIVTDISMPPGLSGLDVLARLKTQRISTAASSCSPCTTIRCWPRGPRATAPPVSS